MLEEAEHVRVILPQAEVLLRLIPVRQALGEVTVRLLRRELIGGVDVVGLLEVLRLGAGAVEREEVVDDLLV